MKKVYDRKDIYKIIKEDGVKRYELAVINIKHYGPGDIPSPVSRDNVVAWKYDYIQPVVEKKEEDDWFMNMIIRDLDRSFSN